MSLVPFYIVDAPLAGEETRVLTFRTPYRGIPAGKYDLFAVEDVIAEPGRGMVQRVGRRVGRNEPCPCGSGRKYKHCCGRR